MPTAHQVEQPYSMMSHPSAGRVESHATQPEPEPVVNQAMVTQADPHKSMVVVVELVIMPMERTPHPVTTAAMVEQELPRQ
jgi:hypothetical protein